MKATAKLENGDRIRMVTDHGSRATATVAQPHTEKGGCSVSIQPDNRPRSAGCIVVDVATVVRVARASRKCPHCSAGHSVWSCPERA